VLGTTLRRSGKGTGKGKGKFAIESWRARGGGLAGNLLQRCTARRA
jgi:hypothetical protein